MSIEAKEEFRPKIVAFCCNWCSYAGADLAGSSRLGYPADVKIIRVPCSCRVNPMFILRAFEKGADGVIMCGCHPGDCHYSTGNYYARRRMTLLFSMLDYIGVENGRTRVEWVSAAEGVKFSTTMNEFVEKAVNFYADYLASDDSGVLLSPAIQSAIDGQLQEFKEQVKSLLFKQAVEMDMGMSVLADCVNLDEEYLRRKRAESVANVKKLNGRIRLEQLAKRAQEQRDGDDGWQD